MLDTFIRGSSDPNGSWKMICARRRKSRSSFRDAVSTSRPSNRTEPEVAGRSRRISRASVLLPEPDSPTRPSTSPRWMSRSTPSTAVSRLFGLPTTSRSTTKCLVRPLTETKGSDGEGSGVEAAELMVGGDGDERRVLLLAAGDAVGAAGGEAAGGRQVGELGDAARDDAELRAPLRPSPACCGGGPACRGASGCRGSRRSGPLSTISPPYITATRSAISFTIPRLCVIRITLIPSSSRSEAISSRICAWIVTSSAVVGSSAISSFGCMTSAIAIITRWRIPPENWCG